MSVQTAIAQPRPLELGTGDALNFAIAKRISETFADALWPGWSQTVPATLLITPRADFYLCLPFELEGMTDLGHQRSIGCQTSVRPKDFDPQRIEAFTLSGRVPTVVIGSPFSAEPFPLWIGIWLHEHFHQYQMGRTGYRRAAEALGLAAEGDRNGHWMVTFPFPYEQSDASSAFSKMSDNLLELLRIVERGGPVTAKELSIYRAAKQAFAEALGDKDYRYAEFVAWQEGVALYTEIRLVEAVADNPAALGELARHVDGRRFGRLGQRLRQRLKSQLGGSALSRHRRLAFYAWGAAEAFVLDAATDGAWRNNYTRWEFRLNTPAASKSRGDQP